MKEVSMRTLGLLILCVSCVLFVAGCGGGSKTLQGASEGGIPDWYTNVPKDPNFVYAANTASSQDLQVAIDRATTGARAEVGRQVEVKVTAMQKRFEEETGAAQDSQMLQQFTSATKTVVSTTLSGSRVKTISKGKEGNMWRAFVLVEYPIGAANQAFLQALKQNEQVLTRVRACESYKELDSEVKKYEDAKQQTPR